MEISCTTEHKTVTLSAVCYGLFQLILPELVLKMAGVASQWLNLALTLGLVPKPGLPILPAELPHILSSLLSCVLGLVFIEVGPRILAPSSDTYRI